MSKNSDLAHCSVYSKYWENMCWRSKWQMNQEDKLLDAKQVTKWKFWRGQKNVFCLRYEWRNNIKKAQY